MSTAFASGVLLLAAGCVVAFVWWMFSGAAAWLEPDEPPPAPPAPLPRISYPEDPDPEDPDDE